MTFRLYTVANDRMAAHLPRFLTLRKCFVPDVPLHIIPFDDDLDTVRRIVADEEQVFLTEPDPRIDEIGKTIYADEDYRPGIPAWRYFRKLNAFVGHDAPLMFLDLNTILLADPREFFDFDGFTRKKIVFGNRSVKFRTIPKPETQDFLNKLNPGWGAGFNAGLMMTRGGFLSFSFASVLKKKNIRKFTGKAPEQGFLALYGAIFDKRARLMAEENASLAPLNAPDDRGVAVVDGVLRQKTGSETGKTLLAVKHVSQQFKEIPDIFERYISERLSKQSR